MKVNFAGKFTRSHALWLSCLLLACATVAVYWPVGGFDFTNYDDPYLISTNPIVGAGLTLKGMWWALTTSFYEYWHPVTWWSHMLDCELFGLHSGWHHMVSLGFHVGNTLILFVVLWRMTSALWRSAVVAALFALHPMHVESVAWLAERKDVLSACFWLLCVWSYADYARRSDAEPSSARVHYLRAIIFFVLGLMSKPMVVTLPFVLLLLDYWPLRRLSPSTLLQLILEKLPFFGLTLVSCVITFVGTSRAGNILSAETVSWGARLANVPVSYVRYLWKLIWPVNLTVLYPMPSHWDAWQVIGAVVLLLLLSSVTVLWFRSAPYLLVGWLLFLGTLVPTVGLVPVGFQSMADRYMYIPSIGLFIAAVWVVADVSTRWRYRKTILGAVTGATLIGCSWLTCHQLQYWRNSFTLWPHCVAVTGDNAVAHFQWGWALQESGQVDAAMTHYREALRIDPDYLQANHNLGVAISATGNLQEATNYYAKALRIKPDYDKAHVSMAIALLQLKDFAGVTNHCASALKVNPQVGQTHCLYAFALVELGDFNGAIAQASEAIQLDPRDFKAFACRARALAAQGQSEAAIRDFAAALSLNPGYADVYYQLGLEFLKRGSLDDAASNFRQAVRFNPASAEAHFQLGHCLAIQHQAREAVAQYREGLQLDPDSALTLNNLAWILATHREPDLRDGAAAVELAERACKLTGYSQTAYVGTLAAAYAENGQLEKAVNESQKACALAIAHGDTNLLERNQELLRHFKNGEPYHEER